MPGRRSPFILLLVLATLVFAACGGDEGDTGKPDSGKVLTAPEDELMRLCPEGAAVLIRVNDLTSFEEELVNLAALVEPAQAEEARISKMLGEDALYNPTLEGVDRSRPFVVALFPTETMAPNPVYILPVTSEAAYRQALEEGPMWKLVKDSTFLKPIEGGWIVQGADQTLVDGVKVNGTPTPLARTLLGGDVAVAVDLAALFELLGPQAEQALAEMDRQVSNVPMPMAGEMWGMMKSGVQSFMTDSESVALSAGISDGDVLLTVRYAAKEGSPTAQALAVADKSKPAYLSKLGAVGFAAVEMNYSGERLWEVFGPIYEKLLEPLGPEFVGTMKSTVESMDGLGFGVSLANGFEVVEIAHITDTEAYEKGMKESLDRMGELMESLAEQPGGGVPASIEIGEVWKHGDVEVTPMNMKMDWASMPNMTPEGAQVLEQFFGKDGFNGQLALVGENAVYAMGPTSKKLVSDTIDRLKGGRNAELPIALTEATVGFPDEVGGLFYMNFSDIARMVGGMEGQVPLPPEKLSLLKSPPPDLYMAGYWGADGPTMIMGLRIRLGKMIEFGKAVFGE